MIPLLVAALITLAPQDDSGLPTPPPSLPTQVVNGDGTRMSCTPDGTFCWPAQ